MKNFTLAILLFLSLSCPALSQDFDDLEITDSVNYQRNNELFERIVEQYMLNYPLQALFPNNDNILNMMMILSEDGFLGFSNSRYLTIESRGGKRLRFRDMEGDIGYLKIGSSGNHEYYGPYGNNISSFQKSYDKYVIKDELGVYYDLVFSWLTLKSITSDSGYVLNIEKGKKGYIISDNQNNSVFIAKNGSGKKIATYSNGKIKESKGGIFSLSYIVTEGQSNVFYLNNDYVSGSFEIITNKGVNLTIRKQDIENPHHQKQVGL
ncbi:hypothetical protein [Sphingobacterium endophyticum]|uniref:hypothetical protein n=1 Tax=Sphingobacterium endophyticum TaxID=2546448 RepID=UPI0012E1C700|nr:hypothetical protein [Sphingobacterium endophyticum]